MKWLWLLLILPLGILHAQEKEIHLPSGPLKYSVEVDWQPIEILEDKEKGTVFYVAYRVPSEKPRPVTFCFNGGPGSASVWIHMAGVGPRTIETPPLKDYQLPIKISDNPYTLLPYTDLVFVDAIYTGFSRPEAPTPASDFFNYNTDILYLSNFIETFIHTHNLGECPLYLLGCSYSTLRIVGLANELQHKYRRQVEALIMFSTLLNFQSLTAVYQQNDSPYPLLIPTYATAAWVHNLGSSHKYSHEDWVKLATEWASEKYLPALMRGDTLSKDEKSKIAEEMSYYIGIDKELIEIRNLRIDSNYYIKELLRKQDRVIGRFDVRYKGIDNDQNRMAGVEADPSYTIMGNIAAGFQDYLRNELNVEVPNTPEYYFLGKVANWRFVKNGLHFLCLNKTLKDLMQKLPKMKIFVGSGLYDLATPYRVAQYDFSHLNLPPSEQHQRVTHKLYEGGHMFYTDQSVLKQVHQDLIRVYQ